MPYRLCCRDALVYQAGNRRVSPCERQFVMTGLENGDVQVGHLQVWLSWFPGRDRCSRLKNLCRHYAGNRIHDGARGSNGRYPHESDRANDGDGHDYDHDDGVHP